MTVWEYRQPPADKIETLHRELRIGKPVAELLARLDFKTVEEAGLFLNPRLSEIADPFEVPNIKAAAEKLSRAIDNRHKIAICGDYDVDGVTSTSLLVAILRQFENFPRFIVPLRLEEGYGLSQKAAERAMQDGARPDLFVALDCGTNSVEEAEYILGEGCDLVIVDHHQSKRPLPEKALLVNPHVYPGADEGLTTLCTVGLVFKLAHALLKIRREAGDKRAFDIKLRDYLDLVSMGTVADLVPLRGENRCFARIGLQVLAKTKRQGLKCLMKVGGVNGDHGVKPVDIAFKLGPRINASGRLADASVAVELILSDDKSYGMEISLQLDSFNRERQEIERGITEEAMKQIADDASERSGLVVFGQDWHPGVVGIVASRVSRAFNRPSIVLGREGNLAKGSGRSIDGVNLVELLGGFSDQMESWGGHPMAVGISMSVDKVEAFKAYFDNAVREFLASHDPQEILNVSRWIRLDEIGPGFLRDFALMEPFGQENPEPIFASAGVVLRQRPTVFKDVHCKFPVQDRNGRSFSVVAWKQADRIPPVNTPIDMAYRLAWNTFGTRRSLQLELVSWRPAQANL